MKDKISQQIKSIDMTSLEELIEKTENIVSDHKETWKGSSNQWERCRPLFRGQCDSDWGLDTTLDRVKKDFNCMEYYEIMKKLIAPVYSFTEKFFKVPNCNNGEVANYWLPPEGFEFMVYLRHHGFPSPLLDWTRSLYIAMFFAFISEPKDGIDKVAIFLYREFKDRSEKFATDSLKITSIGHNVLTHKRHYLQQSEYTICTEGENKEKCYTEHERVLRKSDGKQDLLTKLTVPVTERKKALTLLDEMNINAYSLFGTEEGLMRTLSVRELIL